MAEKVVLSEGEHTVLESLSTIPRGARQRIDGLRCELKVIDLGPWQFWWALKRLRWRGYITRTVDPTHSVWVSCKHLPFFALTEAGRAVLEGAHDER